MPFLLIIAGAFLLISSARNTQSQLFTLLAGDFTGSNNFIYWAVSILIIGAVGYIPKLKPISVGFMTLVIIVLFLKRGNPTGIGGGFFSQFTQGLGSTQAATPSIAASPGGATNNPSLFASGQLLSTSGSAGSFAIGAGSNLASLLDDQGGDLVPLGAGSAASEQGSSVQSLLLGSQPVVAAPSVGIIQNSGSYDILNESYD